MCDKYLPCPRCGGHPDYEPETGVPYTCYFCFDQGVVLAAVVEAEERAERDYREQFLPRVLGVYPRPMGDEYDFLSDDELAAEAQPGHRLFTRLIWPPHAEPRRVVQREEELELDDIPF